MTPEDRKIANTLRGVIQRELPRLVAEAVEVARLDPRQRRNRRMREYMRRYRASRRMKAARAA